MRAALLVLLSSPVTGYGLSRCVSPTVRRALTPAPRLAPLVLSMGRKPGVMPPDELSTFVSDAGDKLIVVDVRNPDFAVEPGDGKSNEKAPLSACGTSARPRAINVLFDRSTNSMDLQLIPQALIDAAGGIEKCPVITHCGGGGRGQKAKEFLVAQGFKVVANGGGPEDDECWAVFGDK